MLKFYHSPWSRSFAIFWLLEELGVPYEMEIVNIRGTVPDDYRAIQPSKKVPAIVHDGKVVTERAAITLYLGETFNEKGLAPAPGDSDRAPYITQLVYHDSVFDPAICARAHKLQYVSNDYPFGTFEDMLAHVERVFTEGPFAAGDRFTLADVIWGTGINYTMNVLGALPRLAVFEEYLKRVVDRPSFQATMAKESELVAKDPALQEFIRQSGG